MAKKKPKRETTGKSNDAENVSRDIDDIFDAAKPTSKEGTSKMVRKPVTSDVVNTRINNVARLAETGKMKQTEKAKSLSTVEDSDEFSDIRGTKKRKCDLLGS